jgi:hypothetical protein
MTSAAAAKPWARSEAPELVLERVGRHILLVEHFHR